MSRSTKKPWVKDKGTDTRRKGNQRFRHKATQICWMFVKHWPGQSEIFTWYFYELPVKELERLLPDEAVFPLLKQVVDGWDICDWRWYRPENPESYRK